MTDDSTRRVRAIRLRRRYRATPARIFWAWFDPEVAVRWLFATATESMAHVEIDARVGGTFRFADALDAAGAAYWGRYEEIVPERRLVFTLRAPRHRRALPVVVESRVQVVVVPSASGSALDLVHEHLPGDEAPYVKDRWTGMLYGLGLAVSSLCPSVPSITPTGSWS
ncbi:MAG: SRPBCC domain-containing protein [Proteobacteria bacterium]|nr:SRPBCC domain-containing protein [Pseudomonadota bacterium]